MNKQKLAEKLKKIRAKTKLSVLEFSKIIKVCPRTVLYYESGQRQPSLEIITKYCLIEDIKFSELV